MDKGVRNFVGACGAAQRRSSSWAWVRNPKDRRFFVGLHLESEGFYRFVTDDFGRLVLV